MDDLKLNYYAAYGTMIGLYRSQNFIPWDADADLLLRKKHWSKFIVWVLKEPLGVKTVEKGKKVAMRVDITPSYWARNVGDRGLA